METWCPSCPPNSQLIPASFRHLLGPSFLSWAIGDSTPLRVRRWALWWRRGLSPFLLQHLVCAPRCHRLPFPYQLLALLSSPCPGRWAVLALGEDYRVSDIHPGKLRHSGGMLCSCYPVSRLLGVLFLALRQDPLSGRGTVVAGN